MRSCTLGSAQPPQSTPIMLFILPLYLAAFFAVFERCVALSLPTTGSPSNLFSRSRNHAFSESHAHCTTNPKWADYGFPDPQLYVQSCNQALMQSRHSFLIRYEFLNNLDASVDFVPGKYQEFRGPLRLPLSFRHRGFSFNYNPFITPPLPFFSFVWDPYGEKRTPIDTRCSSRSIGPAPSNMRGYYRVSRHSEQRIPTPSAAAGPIRPQRQYDHTRNAVRYGGAVSRVY